MILRPLTLIAAAAGVAAYFYLRERPRPPAPSGLEERVRQALSGVLADPQAIHVSAHEGVVSLRGPVLPGERDRALATVLGVPGVMEVSNFLEPVEPLEPMPT